MAAAKKKICFVVGPIGEADSDVRTHADWLLEAIIQPTMADFSEFETIRADQISSPGMIDAQIIRHLIDADLVIADLSGLNPNAFYEIGIRHMVAKPIIHMQLLGETIPFDVMLYRAIKFSRARPKDLAKARRELGEAVKKVTAAGYDVENPVTRANGQIQFAASATPANQVILEELRSVSERLVKLERGNHPPARKARRAMALFDIDINFDGTAAPEVMQDRITTALKPFGGGSRKVTLAKEFLGIDFNEPRPSQDRIEAIADALAGVDGVSSVDV